ncbi:MAG: GDP-mannose 6-dehydrogenase [Hyperionvirus sp.]|uniref:GDP-mannose 6-dehydrogenase n=1 Tax=Hyperionvirus sp. TaxID=2487770 RepID=A0A3G5A9S5_9VIRU|nr:MAG: GDP-mannose 6-dehydrogenase [Hyperionvirus sp.]
MAAAAASIEAKAPEHKFGIVQDGCGVVGGAYMEAYEAKGNKVIGIEANKELINKLKLKFEMYHIKDNLSLITGIDFVMISINTPLKGKKLDLTYLFSSLPNVAEIVKNNPDVMVIIRSTVEPGTTKRYKADLEALVGKRVDVLFQPEFLRAKSALEDARNPWHIVLGVDASTDITKLMNLYTQFTDAKHISTMTIEEAEILKSFHNCYNAAKISWFNQAHLLVKRINESKGLTMDIHKITTTLTKTCEGLLNPKYGTTAGHAFYGSCLPKDSTELATLEQEYGLEAPLFTSVVKVNDIIKRTDTAEIIDGDHHMTFDILQGKKVIL